MIKPTIFYIQVRDAGEEREHLTVVVLSRTHVWRAMGTVTMTINVLAVWFVVVQEVVVAPRFLLPSNVV